MEIPSENSHPTHLVSKLWTYLLLIHSQGIGKLTLIQAHVDLISICLMYKLFSSIGAEDCPCSYNKYNLYEYYEYNVL